MVGWCSPCSVLRVLLLGFPHKVSLKPTRTTFKVVGSRNYFESSTSYKNLGFQVCPPPKKIKIVCTPLFHLYEFTITCHEFHGICVPTTSPWNPGATEPCQGTQQVVSEVPKGEQPGCFWWLPRERLGGWPTKEMRLGLEVPGDTFWHWRSNICFFGLKYWQCIFWSSSVLYKCATNHFHLCSRPCILQPGQNLLGSSVVSRFSSLKPWNLSSRGTRQAGSGVVGWWRVKDELEK